MDDLLGRVDHRLRELLNTGQPIPTYFMYLTHRGYLNWVARTEDPAVHVPPGRAWSSARRRRARSPPRSRRPPARADVDFVSLGPGTGAKDRALIQGLSAAAGRRGGSLCYYPYDINPAMIVHAIQTVLAGDLAAPVLVKGIIAPFDSLGLFSHVYKDRAGPNVLALLGNTLGNMSDDFGFLETLLASGMWPGDLLLLEVRCHVDEDAGAGPGNGRGDQEAPQLRPARDPRRHLRGPPRPRDRAAGALPQRHPQHGHDRDPLRAGALRRHDLAGRAPLLRPRVLRGRPRRRPRPRSASPPWRKFHRGVRGADTERVVLLYLLQKP